MNLYLLQSRNSIHTCYEDNAWNICEQISKVEMRAENRSSTMTRFSLQNPNPTSELQESKQAKNAILHALKAFWQFSRYYGAYMSTPVFQRRNVKLPRVE